MIDVRQVGEKVFEEAVRLRRDIHAHPELSNKEERTSELVAKYLKDLGLEVRENVGGYGVVGLLKGEKEGKCIAFRADMDALEVTEETGLEFSSKNEGVMHACGHDGHVAILLCVAKILSEIKHDLAGCVKFLFQPAEEVAPGGARSLISEGVLENPKVDSVFALHIVPVSPVGQIYIKNGAATTAADIAHIKITGKGGHGSEPHTAHDAVLAAAEIVCGLQNIVSRYVDPKEFAVVNVGKLQGGTMPNIISGYAEIELCTRSLNEDTRKVIVDSIEQVVCGISAACGVKSEITFDNGYDSIFNTQAGFDFAFSAINKHIDGAAREVKNPLNGSEDFSFLLNEVGHGAFMVLGGRDDKDGTLYSNHHPKFDWHEEAMKNGIAALVSIAVEYLIDE